MLNSNQTTPLPCPAPPGKANKQNPKTPNAKTDKKNHHGKNVILIFPCPLWYSEDKFRACHYQFSEEASVEQSEEHFSSFLKLTNINAHLPNASLLLLFFFFCCRKDFCKNRAVIIHMWTWTLLLRTKQTLKLRLNSILPTYPVWNLCLLRFWLEVAANLPRKLSHSSEESPE